MIYKCTLVTNLALGLWPKLRHEKGNGLEKCFGIQACSKCKEGNPLSLPNKFSLFEVEFQKCPKFLGQKCK
jgi:hypothetical protein